MLLNEKYQKTEFLLHFLLCALILLFSSVFYLKINQIAENKIQMVLKQIVDIFEKKPHSFVPDHPVIRIAVRIMCEYLTEPERSRKLYSLELQWIKNIIKAEPSLKTFGT